MNTTHGQNSQTKTEKVRTIAGKPVATIKTNTQTGVQRGYDNLGNFKGTYDPRRNLTFDEENRPVSKGNGLIGVVINSLCHKGMGAVCHPVAVVESSLRPRNAFRPIPVNPLASTRTPYLPAPVAPSAYLPRSPWRRW